MSGQQAYNASYVEGDWVALATGSTWLLVEVTTESPVVMAVWELLLRGGSVEELLDSLVAGGIAAAPAFALVRLNAHDRRAVVRGAATMSLETAEGKRETLAARVGTAWIDHVIDEEVATIVLGSGVARAHGVELPMAEGVSTASAIRVSRGDAESEKPSTSTWPVDGTGVKEARLATATQQDQAPDSALQSSRGASADTHVEPEIEPMTEQQPVPGASADAKAQSEPKQRTDDAPTSTYDHLFGATQRPPVVEPEYYATPRQDPGQDDSVTAASGDTQTWSTLSGEEARGLIDSVPGMGLVTPTSAPSPETLVTSAPAAIDAPPLAPIEPTPATRVDPDAEIRTVNRAQLLAETIGAGPLVLAAYCHAGHPTPVQSPNCRVCGTPVAEQHGVQIPRPPLGVLKLSTGDTIVLDRAVLFGRAPEAHADPADRPNAVRLASPNNELSRNHAEIVLDGWSVYVRDLGSTNGTMITLPGQPPVRLRANDLFALEPQAVVNLADEVTMTFEVLP